MDEIRENESQSLPDLRQIVAKAVRYAALRFPESEEIRRLLNDAEIVESGELSSVVDVVPPRQRGGASVIRFSEKLLADLRREHRYPEWVLCATIERMILGSAGQWPLDEQEAKLLAAHRERRRRAPSSGTGPASQD
jgi:hypothetical protein